MAKTIFDFMADKEELTYESGHHNAIYKDGHYVGSEWKNVEFTILNNHGKLRLVVDGQSCEITDKYDLIDMVEKWCDGHAIRICDYCGCIMEQGYTDDDADFYNCEECFPKDMNERYGEGNWRAQSKEDYGDDCNYMGGFYEYKNKNGEWEPEPSFYTEWN